MPEKGRRKKKIASDRPNKLTQNAITMEANKLKKLFEQIGDENKKALVNALIEEAAFLKVACKQAKEEIKKEGLTTETINASQHFIKAHPSVGIYKDYSKQYAQIINQLIEHLPPNVQKKVSKLAALRDA